MSEHEETKEQREARILKEAVQRIQSDASTLYVSLIKLRNILGDSKIKNEIRSVLDTLRERINQLDKQTRK